jgi:hypothetical protein
MFVRVIPANDVADLFNLKQSLGKSKRYCFRGHSDASWDLIPTMFRQLIGKDFSGITLDLIGRYERDMYRKYERHAHSLINARDKWESLCIAQHYGAPTRLLDWTRNLFVATYFALIADSSDPDKAAVWGLNLTDYPFPDSLGRQVNDGAYRLDNIRNYCGEKPASFSQAVSESTKPWRRRNPKPEGTFVVFESPSVVPRIENQEGLFSVYLSFNDYDFVWNYSDYIAQVEQTLGVDLLVKIEILKTDANKIRMQIEETGINPYRLFPDLVGLGMMLKAQHEHKFLSEVGII